MPQSGTSNRYQFGASGDFYADVKNTKLFFSRELISKSIHLSVFLVILAEKHNSDFIAVYLISSIH